MRGIETLIMEDVSRGFVGSGNNKKKDGVYLFFLITHTFLITF